MSYLEKIIVDTIWENGTYVLIFENSLGFSEKVRPWLRENVAQDAYKFQYLTMQQAKVLIAKATGNSKYQVTWPILVNLLHENDYVLLRLFLS